MSDYLDSLYSSVKNAITAAIGYNDGANKGFWRIQPRDFKGRWIEMGAELRAAFKVKGKIVSPNGIAVGSTGKPDEVRMLIVGMGDMGIPDGIYPVKSKHAELIGATLSDEYLRSKGIDPNADQNGNPLEYGSITEAADVPNIEDIERTDITPEDLRLADMGQDTPEGKEQAAFKDTPEGQAIAKLPSDAAAKATKGAKDVQQIMKDAGIGRDAEGRFELENATPKQGDYRPPMRKYGGIWEEKGRVYDNGKWRPATVEEDKANGYHQVAARRPDMEISKLEDGPILKRIPGDDEVPQMSTPSTDWTETPNGGAMMAMPNGAVINVGRDGSYSILDNKGYSDNFAMYSAETAPGLEAGKSNALAAFNKNPDAFVWKSAEHFGPGWEMKDYGNGKGQYMKDNDPSQSFRIGENVDGTKGYGLSFSSRNYNWGEAAYDEGIEDQNFSSPEMALAAARDFIDKHPSENADAADNAVADLMEKVNNGDDVNPNEWLNSAIDDLGGDSGDEDGDGTPDEEDPDFEPDEDATDFESDFDEPLPELSRDIISKERAEAGDVGPDDIIMGPGNVPVKVKRTEWDESEYDEEPAGLNIVAVNANGEEVEFYKGRYDTVFYPEFADETTTPEVPETPAAKPAAKKAKKVAPSEEVTPEPVAEPEATRVAPDTAFESDAAGVQIGDKLYSPDGSTFLGEVTQTRKKGGKTEARLNLDGRDEGFQELGPTNLIDRNPEIAAQKQADKDAKKAKAAEARKQARLDAEKEAADNEAKAKDPYTDEGLANIKSILEAADNPGRFQPAFDVLNDSSLSNQEKAEQLLKALTTNRGPLNGTDDQRIAARQAESKVLKMLENAKVPGTSPEEVALQANKRRSLNVIRSSRGDKFSIVPSLKEELDNMATRIDSGEDVPLEELEALSDKIGSYYNRFWMAADEPRGGGKPTPKKGEVERVEEEIRKSQRAGDTPIPYVFNGKEIRPDDNATAPGAPATPGGNSAPTTPASPTQYKTPAPTPSAPKHPKPVKKTPKAKPIGTPDDHGRPIKGDYKTDADIEAMRNRKLENAIDENGDPVYAKDVNGNILTDKKGRPIPLQDTDAILAALRADYPDAKLNDTGDIVVHREMYTAADGSKKMFEVLVHMNTGGKIGLSMQFTDPATGEVERLIHHDERDSYMGLHGKTNGIQALIDIVQGKKPNTDRRTATRGYDTTGRTDYRERAEYFVRQGRLLTQQQVWDKYLSGMAEEINTSAGGRGVNKGKAYLTKRQSEVPSAAEALRQGDRELFFQRVRAAVGHTPVHPTQRAEMRKAIRDYLEREMPQMSARERTILAQYVDRHLVRRGELVDPTGRDIPFVSRETRKLEPGTWVDYINNFGEKSRGRVVSLDEPQLNEAGTEYYDNVTVEFADGTRVSMLTSQNMMPVPPKEQSKATATKYIPNVRGEEMRRRRREQLGMTAARTTGVLRFLEDVRAEEAEIAENANKSGGKVEDLNPGDTLFSKEGEPLGPIIEKIPIVGKSGNPGYAVIFENADGEEVQVRLPLGEFRGPKA